MNPTSSRRRRLTWHRAWQVFGVGMIMTLFLMIGCTSTETSSVAEEETPCRERSSPPGDESPNGVVFRTDQECYSPGERPILTLENRSSSPVSYNICFAFLELERFEDGAWRRLKVNLGPGPPVACDAALRTLAPGESDTSSIYLPPDLPAGRHRIVSQLEIGRQEEKVTTNEFGVE